MISAKLLKDVVTEARPILERMLDDAEVIAGFRDVIAENGGDWSSLKALMKAQIQDERDEAGGNKRVQKILDRADSSAAYADMLGLGNVTDLNYSAETPHDPETGEILEQPVQTPVAQRQEPSPSKRQVGSSNLPGRTDAPDIPSFLDRRAKGPPQPAA